MNDEIRFFLRPAVLFVWLVGTAIAFIAPVDVLSANPGLNAFTEMMSNVFNAINIYRKNSTFPEVSVLYFSVMFLIGAVWLIELLRVDPKIFIKPDSMLGKAIIERKKSRYVYILISIAMFWGLGFGVFQFSGFDWEFIPINSSRFSLAIFGAFLSAGPYLLIALPISAMKLDFQFSKNKGDGGH